MTIRLILPNTDNFQMTPGSVRDIYVADTNGNRTQLHMPTHGTMHGLDVREVVWTYDKLTIPAGSTVSFVSMGRATEARSDISVMVVIELDGVKIYEWVGESVWRGETPSTINEWSILDNVTTTPQQPSGWAQDAVDRADKLGLLPVYFRFGFSQATTRLEYTTIAVALIEHLQGPITGGSTFVDTNDVNVQKAAYIGLVAGVGNNRFDPHSPLTREQAAVMLARMANILGRPFPDRAPTFADNNLISGWAVEGVGRAQASGIMTGVGNNRFAPRDSYTKEQAVVTMIRMLDYVNNP